LEYILNLIRGNMGIPTNDEILALLNRLEFCTAEELETQWLDFKPWNSPKEAMKVAIEYAVCFANAGGGAVLFGVADRLLGRKHAIHGASGYDLDTWRRSIFDATRPNLTVEVDDLSVPEGTGKLLIVRVPKGANPPYGTAQGLFKKRVGMNCMPMDGPAFIQSQVSTGALDWSGQPAMSVEIHDLDHVEIARARNILRRIHPNSRLLELDDPSFLVGLGAVRQGRVTHTGLLLFGNEELLSSQCPQNQVHYVHEIAETKVQRNDSYRTGLLNMLERIEQAFRGPANPEQEISSGLYKLRIPAYPIEVVREAILNAVTHRDYRDPGEVLIHHMENELVVSSPGSFLAGITPQNILRHEPISRNRTLAEAFEKLCLVERAGIGRRRIFIPMLSVGKRVPEYESDKMRVILRIFNNGLNERLSILVAKWRAEDRQVGIDSLLVLAYLRNQAFIEGVAASRLLQMSREDARSVLDRLTDSRTGFLERRGSAKASVYHLRGEVAEDLSVQSAQAKNLWMDPVRFSEIVRAYLEDHGSITPKECRELLGYGESKAARVEVSRYLKKWSARDGFLQREGKPPRVRYFPRHPNRFSFPK
jgi:ATP-dependent DNA helicase RecG